MRQRLAQHVYLARVRWLTDGFPWLFQWMLWAAIFTAFGTLALWPWGAFASLLYSALYWGATEWRLRRQR